MSKAMQASSRSYFDWSIQFSKIEPNTQQVKMKPKETKLNSLGIDKDEFKKFLGAWKQKNLNS